MEIEALRGLSYDIYEGCPDPVADEDESDVYREKVNKVCFLGIPCSGGDYNAGMVTAKRVSVKGATEAIIRLAQAFSELSNTASSLSSPMNLRRP